MCGAEPWWMQLQSGGSLAGNKGISLGCGDRSGLGGRDGEVEGGRQGMLRPVAALRHLYLRDRKLGAIHTRLSSGEAKQCCCFQINSAAVY